MEMVPRSIIQIQSSTRPTMAFSTGKFYASLLVALLCRDYSSAWAPLPTNVGSHRTPLMMTAGKSKGTVKWFDADKGFGFITPDDGTDDVFVHQTSIQTEGFRSLADGENVEYVAETDDNSRLRAAQVTGPDGATVQGATFPEWKRSMN